MGEVRLLVIFGATGDLTKRKLLPALAQLHAQGAQLLVLGIGRRDLNDESFRINASDALEAYAKLDRKTKHSFLKTLFYHRMDYTRAEEFEGLRDRIELMSLGQPLFYLATKPGNFGAIARSLKRIHLVNSQSKVAFEKPFGTDLMSAFALNKELSAVFPEEAIYRIDHYLGKESVQNLLTLRFANSFLEPLWNYRYIDHIQITVAETLGVGTRGGYYDEAGALRDMVQNHLFQILMYVAMEPPPNLDADAIEDEKVKVLKSLCPATLREHVVRGQYTAGTVEGKRVRGYQQEPGVKAGSRTETFVALKLRINNWRWRGMPIYVRTGKRLQQSLGEVIVQFKRVPINLFGDELEDNLLRFRLQPVQATAFQFNTRHGPGIAAREMEFYHSSTYSQNTPGAYVQLLTAFLNGDRSLFTRWDQVAHAWQLIDPLLRRVKPHPYRAGTWGPEAAAKLIEQDGRRWIL
ncbi:glucose-6-phosphate dehydrogenase [Candidatus Woesearchaeota archaeon]|nr:MAG: glucose-6-phosphate dehydrogenase [Candidatus Woesearchaeota archaeon]